MNPQLLQLIFFYAFGVVATGAALAVISLRNSVHAVLALVLTFFSVACLWLLAEAEFLAIALIVVYVGAVMVLFLFVVMMLDIKMELVREGFARYLPVGIIVALIMLAEMLALIGVRAMNAQQLGVDPASVAGLSNTAWLGMALYTQFLFPFEIAALILTVGIVAAVALTLRQRTGVRHQSASQQVAVDARNRVRLVKMASETMPTEITPPVEPPQETAPVITLAHYIVLGAVMFCIAVAGIFINRKNVIVLLMAIELMLLAVNINFVAFSRFSGDVQGQVFVFFILTVAAAESAIGLAILVLLFRNRSTINVGEIDSMKG